MRLKTIEWYLLKSVPIIHRVGKKSKRVLLPVGHRVEIIKTFENIIGIRSHLIKGSAFGYCRWEWLKRVTK